MTITSRGLEATLLLIGTIIGVGMFGIPFVFVQAGWFTGFVELIVLAAMTTIIHLAYGEVVLATASAHRIPGYVTLYLGKLAGWIARLSYIFGISAALLAYIVLGGFFLDTVIRWFLPVVPHGAGVILFFLFGAYVISRSIQFEGGANAFLTVALIGIILALSASLIPAASARVFTAFQAGRVFVPYGVLLFSLTGAAVIPEMKRLLKTSELPRLRRYITIGTITSAAIYLVFTTAVVGVTGAATSPDAISALADRVGPIYLFIGGIIGFLAATTSFIALGMTLKDMFIADLGLPPITSWFLVIAIPAGSYLLGATSFITIISIVGAFAIGLDDIFVLLIHKKCKQASTRKPEYRIAISPALRVLMILLFGAGVGYQVLRFFL